MAHEIRTPLHQVTGFIDLLELDAFEQKNYIKLLKSSANQLMTVISDVLDYSKLEAGKMKTERIPFELLSVVQGSMEAVRGSCEEKGLYLTLEYEKKKPDCYPNIRSNDIPFRVLGDPNRLRQVLLNLLSNAVKFTEKGGIHVRVSSSDEEFLPRSLRIIVTDTGMGISKEQQDAIFEKYQQANLSVARNFGGTGLGLSICKLLVEQTMGGSIGVDSDGGRGSSFYVMLPIELPRECIDETSRGANGGKDNQENGASMNILVAEDNKINQKLVANMLKRMGHKSTLVENGRQAIDMIVRQNSLEHFSTALPTASNVEFDAVLMDIQMPVMDGLEATRRLRTMGYTDLPIVGLTASVKRSDYIELGFNDWLPKPILMKDLKAKLLKLQTDQLDDSDESRAPG
eukprot:jgi/Psemu1/240188/estExt_Genewise1.C_1740040